MYCVVLCCVVLCCVVCCVVFYLLLPQLPGCPRSLLDTDNVLYLHTDAERLPYVVLIDQGGLLRYPRTNTLVSTGKEGWIFVTKNGILYACAKQTKAVPRWIQIVILGGEYLQLSYYIKINITKREHCHSFPCPRSLFLFEFSLFFFVVISFLFFSYFSFLPQSYLFFSKHNSDFTLSIFILLSYLVFQ